ncbi:DUF155-domain-containing protein [Gonapodya prolifera JEL478]|uniref:DUF155-domain-containing protein n=1 Tax=Gonapodya prolifera (strain JEL478) TaxID=1344416 RepID=A0A139B1A9_GONPJ|nr:DUF155-domain-containing protein [Gonapodya prolifera JEL478]|eukprot:KXS22583.1 DUF155-domain-containing protein [Gonapodya prolifera JEL478]
MENEGERRRERRRSERAVEGLRAEAEIDGERPIFQRPSQASSLPTDAFLSNHSRTPSRALLSISRRASLDETEPSLPGAFVPSQVHDNRTHPHMGRSQSGRQQLLPGTVLNVPKPDGKVHPQRTTKTTQKLVALPSLAPLALLDDASSSPTPTRVLRHPSEATVPPFASTFYDHAEDDALFHRQDHDGYPDADLDLDERDVFVRDLVVAENEILVPDVERGYAPPPSPTPYPRVTGYCTADSYGMPRLQSMFEGRGRKWRQYDEAAYVVIEGEGDPLAPATSPPTSPTRSTRPLLVSPSTPPRTIPGPSPSTHASFPPRALFLFAFGVAVFWGFSEADERRVLEVVQEEAQGGLAQGEWQVEDLRFEYEEGQEGEGGRIYNDVLTLRTPHHLAKLALSHAIAQSVKLAVYESLLLSTLSDTRTIPQQMATKGEVDMSRGDVVRVVGGLFRVRTEVNLVSNVLDSPEVFWDRPELAPLYNSMRVYLEITQRASVLNHRALVISDLVDVLTEHLNHSKMDTITWIIIWLIVVDVVVMVMEVVVKVRSRRRKLLMCLQAVWA